MFAGPHSQHSSPPVHSGSDNGTTVTLTASVLSLRGQGITSQPIVSPNGSLQLAFNGQIYSINTAGPSSEDEQLYRARRTAAQEIANGCNDGVVLMKWLDEVISLLQYREPSRSRVISHALHIILDGSSIEAEWAFTLIDKETGFIYFGRDQIGRRSLLMASPSEQTPLLLASTASRDALDAGLTFEEVDCGSLWSWDIEQPDVRPFAVSSWSQGRCILRELDPGIEQTNARFQEPTSEDRQDGLRQTHAALLASVSARVNLIQGATASEQRQQAGSQPTVAILFSGGLDSTLLAYYAHLCLPEGQPIDLINVAFENPRVLKAAAGSNGKKVKMENDDAPSAPLQCSRFNTPDRLLSRVTRDQLQSVSPGREWRLLEVDVSYDDYNAHKDEIMATMAPSDSVMDLSLASVLFFASRGVGHLSGSTEPYTCSARVYISGLGADELCGGYSRHRKAYEQGDWEAVAKELQMDLDRLPTRNLGRDDRILSCHGREARYPFLALPFIRLMASLPLQVKAELSLPLGIGDKHLLRALAERCGLSDTAKEKKRAMQWGARSAKMEAGQGKIKGHHSLAVDKKPVVTATSPQSVFTTMLYDPRAKDGQADLLDRMLPETLRETKYSEAASSETWLEACIPLLFRHLERLASSCAAMEQQFAHVWSAVHAEARRTASQQEHLLSVLSKELADCDVKSRVRMDLDVTGHVSVTKAAIASPTQPVKIPVVRLDTQPSGPSTSEEIALYLNKTSSRSFYDEARARVGATLGMADAAVPAPCFDVLMWTYDEAKQRRYLTESSIGNVLIENVMDTGPSGETVHTFLTPRIRSQGQDEGSEDDGKGLSSDGPPKRSLLLPGLMRQYLLERTERSVREADVEVGELLREIRAGRRRVWLCNALRGVFEVQHESSISSSSS